MSQESPKSAPESRDSWRAQLRLKAGILLGVACLAGAASVSKNNADAAPKASGIGKVGFTDSSIFNKDLAMAEATATRIAQMGGTAIRFIYPLNKGTAWENYSQETCNAFQAAHDHNLQPIVTFQGFDENGPGYVPRSNTEIKHFSTTAASIIWTVASKKDGQHPGGCVPDQNRFIFEGINEINNGVPFNSSLGVNTPAEAALMDHQLSIALRREAAKPEIQATVSFGESLAASNHDPIQFLNDEALAATKLGLKLKYDFIDIHPYPKGPTTDPSLTMQALYQPAKDAISNLSPGAELVWGEIGVNTVDPPAIDATGYTSPVSHSIGVNESTQVKYITNVLKTAAAEVTPWVTLFDVQDDGSGSMPSSGLYYVNGQPKTSMGPIVYRINQSQQK